MAFLTFILGLIIGFGGGWWAKSKYGAKVTAIKNDL